MGAEACNYVLKLYKFPLVLLQAKVVGSFVFVYSCCFWFFVSISSPSSEGGGKGYDPKEWEAQEKFPLVLLQAKVVGFGTK